MFWLALLGTIAFLGLRRASVAQNNLVVGINAFRIHQVSTSGIKAFVTLGVVNSSNQTYTISKIFLLLKYPKGNLTNSFDNVLATAENASTHVINPRSTKEIQLEINIPALKLLNVLKEYFFSNTKMIGEVTGTIAFSGQSSGFNIPPFEVDIRQHLKDISSQLQGILQFLGKKK